MICSVNDVRIIGKLPSEDKLDDQYLTHHLLAAARELKNLIGDYADTTDQTKKDACRYAEACLCIANALPVLNTFYTSGITTLQKELGDLDFIFNSASDVEVLQKMWRNKAKDSIGDYIEQEQESNNLGFIAI